MADVEGPQEIHSEQQSADVSCEHVKESSIDECPKEPSADAELDDILEGALQ